jgi:preprotein translocase subunit SecG
LDILYKILLALGLITAVGFSFLVFATGKGDAMAGGSNVRTTFKGKASFDDLISRMTLILGISFMILMLVLDAVANAAARAAK